MITVIDHKFATDLSVKEVAAIFRDSLQDGSGIDGLLARKALGWTFTTPKKLDDPFAVLDGQGCPDFSVAANYAMRGPGGEPMTRIGKLVQEGGSGAIVMRIWDRGSYREVHIRRDKGMSRVSKSALIAILGAFEAADESVVIEEEISRVQEL